MFVNYSALQGLKPWPALLLVAGLALSACQNKQAALDSDPLATGSTGAAQSASPTGEATGSFKRTELLSQQYAADPSNLAIGLDYAANLQKMGQTDAQVGVLKSISVAHANDGPLQAKLGKQLLTAGRAGEAIPMLERAAAMPGVEWQTLSALGSAYEDRKSVV